MINPDKFAALRKTVDTLNTAADHVTKMLMEVEERLRGVGVEAWVPTPMGRFGYRKFGNAWRLAIWTTQEEPQALLSASRGLRIECLGHLDALVDALDKRATELIDKAAELVAGQAQSTDPAK